MKLLRKVLISAALMLLLSEATAQGVRYSTPVGGQRKSAAANTDTLVSPTFMRPAIWRGTAASAGGSTIVLSDTPAWEAGSFSAFGKPSYVRFVSGSLKGHYFTITACSSSTLTVDNAGFDLSQAVNGDGAEVAPYWTLITLFPASAAGTSFIASPNAFSRQTELLFFDATQTGINRAPSSTYYFSNGAWRKTGAAVVTSFDDTVIYPDTYFLMRNKAGATTITHSGRVQEGALGTVIVATSSTENDNFLALSFPADVTLDQSGLANGAFTATTTPFQRKDTLLWFNPENTGINNAASAVYYYYNGAWRKVGSPITTDFGSTVKLNAGSGFIIRKASAGSTGAWVFQTLE